MAQKVSELMTSAPVTLSSGQTVADAAWAMREAGIGDVLILNDGQLISPPGRGRTARRSAVASMAGAGRARNNRRGLGSDYGFSPTRADQGET
jgi:CBS domain-containing protein